MDNITEWASKKLSQNVLLLDTETTGLHRAEIVDIAIIDVSGRPLINTLIKPKKPIPQAVSRIHGITDEMVECAPTFPEVYESIRQAIEGQHVLIYNESFDRKILDYNCELHGLSKLEYQSECLMIAYAAYVGEWSDYWQNYRWQPLPAGNHRALGDCQAALKVLRKMGLPLKEAQKEYQL